MKKMIVIASSALFSMLLIGTTVSAQTKFAHVAYDEIVQLMPEMDSALVQVDAAYKEAQETYTTMLNEYQSKAEQFQQKQETWTPAVKDSKARELSEIENRINEFQQAVNQDMTQLQQTLMQPIQEKVQDAINSIAKSKGVIYVFNSSSLLYIDNTQSIDLMQDARKYLGIPNDRTIQSVMAARQAQAQAQDQTQTQAQ